MSRRLSDYSSRELDVLAANLRLLAANRESVAVTVEKLDAVAADAGAPPSDAASFATSYRAEAASLDEAANVLRQLSKQKTGARP
ncbi:hypothetical protein J7444_08010 [Labrenzia sp. R4_1]|uniref:hypothetical protein n=1 Tax=Labrenzia sp. R4_1 TaxID=2821106 RepID=UPI001ADC64C7|nr:hypothetical protein [Labrenzia sp. R4_1]MBO9424661.1 hypothetical protein [Labrenzia sp. R4_1]